MPRLEVRSLAAGYGRIRVLDGITLDVEAGEIGLILGPNGAGKTTLLRAISALCDIFSGEVRLEGVALRGRRPHEMSRLGLAHVAEGRQLFPDMTVRENLDLGAQGSRVRADRASSLEFVYSLFPVLEQRAAQRAGTLSGGEQQMLAIGRALMSKPRVLLLDEPSTGLAPRVMAEVVQALGRIAATGASLLLVEQVLPPDLPARGTGHVLRDGRIVHSADAEQLIRTPTLARSYFGGDS